MILDRDWTPQIIQTVGFAIPSAGSAIRRARKVSQAVRIGSITPRDRDALQAETVRLFRANPVAFAGPEKEQTAQHLRFLQRAIISLVAQTRWLTSAAECRRCWRRSSPIWITNSAHRKITTV